jgi:DNA polymerase III epsilon subunit-like protein
MTKIILDTETTGFPDRISFDTYYHPSMTKHYETSRLIELGYIICSDDGTIIKTVNNLVKPNNFKINNSFVHGITDEIATRDGFDVSQVINLLKEDLFHYNISTIIAHNLSFDINILLSECYRIGSDEIIYKLENMMHEDTMVIGKEFMKTKKSPRLIELYEFLFKEPVKQDHRALADADICMKCYYKMK